MKKYRVHIDYMESVTFIVDAVDVDHAKTKAYDFIENNEPGYNLEIVEVETI